MPLGAVRVAALMSGGTDVATYAWMASVVTQGGTVSVAQQLRINTLITGLRAKGLWSLIDYALPIAAENTQQTYTDLKSLLVASPVNSPTLTAAQGVAGNGTTSYVNTTFVPNVNGVALSLNSGHVSVYNRTNNTVETNAVAQFASGDAAFTNVLGMTLSPGVSPQATMYANQTTANNMSSTPGTAQGFWVYSRTGSAGANTSGMRNGTALTFSATNASTAVNARAMFIDAFNNAGAASSFCTDQIAFVTIGGGLSTQNQTDLTTLINAYMTSLGTNVF